MLPNRRHVNMVFQQYALFPHMSVYDNVAFGLKVKRVPRARASWPDRADAQVVELEGLERRRPRQLSGGQQQRVALARALVNLPAALLLDEPLGALDVKLRKQMQLELKRIQHELGTTFVYVTHDQEEALAMSDRIAVMNGGRVEQIGGPREIYEHPAHRLRRRFHRLAERARADSDGARRAATPSCSSARGSGWSSRLAPRCRSGDALRVAVRPERVQIGAGRRGRPETGSRLEGDVSRVVYLGMYTQFHVETAANGRSLPSPRGRRAGADHGRRTRHRSRGSRTHTSVLGDAVPPRFRAPRSAARGAPPDLGGDDDEQREDHHDDGDGDHLRELAREAQGAVEVDRERRVRADDERRHGVLVERRRERDQERRDDRREDQRQDDRPERPQIRLAPRS